MLNLHRVFVAELSSVYPFCVQKAEKKGRTPAEVDRVICWRTGDTQAGLDLQLKQDCDFETLFAQTPAPNPNVALEKNLR